jgi:hypothetical protein
MDTKWVALALKPRPGQHAPSRALQLQSPVTNALLEGSDSAIVGITVVPAVGLANELSAVGVLTSLVRFDRFEGTACLFHL